MSEYDFNVERHPDKIPRCHVKRVFHLEPRPYTRILPCLIEQLISILDALKKDFHQQRHEKYVDYNQQKNLVEFAQFEQCVFRCLRQKTHV